MKRFAVRVLALLLAVLLTGVFPVLAEEYVEYSGGLSVADARAANGADTDVYVCVDGVWNVVGEMSSTEVEIVTPWYTQVYDVLNVADLPAALADYGYTSYSTADPCFAVTIDGSQQGSIDRQLGWDQSGTIPLGTTGFDYDDNGSAFGLYYTPVWPQSNNYYLDVSVLADANSFYSIEIQGLTDAELADVDYGDAFDTDFGHLVFSGETATVTVPVSGHTWSYAGEYGSVTISETADAATYTFDNVTGPITLTAADAGVKVTVQQLGLDGSVIASQTYQVEEGGTLPAEALAGYDSQYLWYAEDGSRIYTPATKTFNADATITTKPTAVTSGAGANFYVYLDGAWKLVGTADRLYGPYNTNGASRYLIGISQMEEAFAPYGFDPATYTNPSDRRLVYNYAGNTAVWADTTSLIYYGEWALPLSTGLSVYDVYYLPDNASDIYGTQVNNFAASNAFWTVTLTEEGTGATAEFILEEETVLSTWLEGMATTTLPGWTAPVGKYEWTLTDDGSVLSNTATANAVQDLTATLPTVTVTLVDEAGNTLAVVENVERGASITNWLQANEALALDDGLTIHEYNWSLLNDTAIGAQTFTRDMTLVGAKKPVYTVTFLAAKPGEALTGGEFIDNGINYTTVQVLEGDCIPAEFIARMRQNIRLEDTWAFVEWQYEGNEGYLVMDSDTPIVQDTIVWADYTQEVYVRFWTDRSKTTQFAGTGLETQPVGKKYEGAVPDEAAVLAVAPVEGMRFRYWYDLNSGAVFTVGSDQVKGNLDLYPVFERAIFAFTDADSGESLTVLYDGTDLAYEADAREGYYFAGLEVACSDGSTLLIPNGTQITRDYLIANNVPLPTPVSGRYTIPATPVYRQQRSIVYHTGEDAQFIIFGAENQETYEVDVDNDVVLLGALDIINVASPIGLALDGWTTVEGSADVQFAPNAAFEGSAALDALVGAGETVHLYPVWAQQANTIAVTFVSQYPGDAVDATNNPLTERRYTVYIKEGSKPTMPTLQKAGMQVPANVYSGAEQRYVLAGWSKDEDGKLSNSDTAYTKEYGTYTAGSQYELVLTQDTTFYAVWVDKAPTTGSTAYFFIHLDGTIPFEPSQYTPAGYTGSCSNESDNAWRGSVKKEINVVNNVPEVEANILTEPSAETMYNALINNTGFPAEDRARLNALSPDDYGTEWWVDWYACKYSCGSHYHVDGRVRFSNEVQLNYHPNGGSNVPQSSKHDKDSSADIDDSVTPVRENFIFIGWDEDPAATVPDYPASGLSFPTSPNLDAIWMDADKDLYAIWRPVEITIPMDDDFKGQKYEQTNNGLLTPPRDGRTYQFTIEAISLPEGAAPYQKRTVTSKADGSFTFPQIHVQVAGMYVFEVCEVIGDLPVQYDTAVYRLTINIVESDYGLGIAGYSFTRNNKVITVTDNNVDNVVFTFTNRTDIRSVTATKVWDDEKDQDGLRPSGVNVTLRRRGDSIFSESATLTAAGGWTWTWEELDIKDASTGEIYEYYIIEENVSGYTAEYTGDMNAGLVVTNFHQPATVDFPVVKMWQDNGDAQGLRPETLTYTLIGSMPDGTVVSTTSSGPVTDPWSFIFRDMPLFHNGEHLLYTLTEDPVPGYETAILPVGDGGGGATFNVTNTLTATNVTVTKQITGNAAHMDATFPFTARVYDRSGGIVFEVPAGEGYTVDADGTIRFTLGHGGSVTLPLLPLEGTLVLTEESGDYVVTCSPEGEQSASGMRFEITAGLTVTVTNTRETAIPTGVTLDGAPYLLLLGLAVGALAGLAWHEFNRRRHA